MIGADKNLKAENVINNSQVLGGANTSERPTFLLLMEDYLGVYTNTVKTDPEINSLPYQMCLTQLFSMLLYYGDAYINALSSQGLSAQQIVPMCQPLQHKWASEHGVWTLPSWVSRFPFRWYWTPRLNKSIKHWDCRRILNEYIKTLQPRFIWVFSGVPLTHNDLLRWRAYAERILLWWSSRLKPEFPYDGFDLIFSGIPSLVRHFQTQGLNTAYLPHAFDPKILRRVPSVANRIPRVAFVGRLSPSHRERIKFFDSLSRRVELDFYGHGINFLPKDSPLRARYHGPAWGKDLYGVYGSYSIVFHKNIDMAGNSASAKRLFEATGMGGCVVTEAGDNLEDLFQPGREVVTYSSFDECVDKIKYLLDNPQEALQIGRNGQSRTLTEHTYERRVQQLKNYMMNFGFL